MAEAFIVRRGGVGSSGGTLVVTSSGAGTVTVSNNALGKSYSKSVTAGGSVRFKGLKTGEWTVTVSNGTQTTVKSVTVNVDYSVSIAYFAAHINVTYPAYSTCTCQNGSTTLTDTNTGASAKTVTFTVPNTGTWTVTATNGSGNTKSTAVSITADGQSTSVTLSYELVLLSGTIGRDNWNLITSGNDTISFNNYGIVSTNTGYSSAGVTKSRLNVANYNTLKVDFNLSADSNNDVLIGISESRNSFEGINSSYIYKNPGDYGFVANSKSQFSTAGNYSLSLNLSAVSGTFYIWVYRRYGSTCTFTDIRLLPN